MPKPPTLTTPQLVDPRKLRAQATVMVELGDGTCVKARRLDMSALVFEGLLPMPLLVAVQAMTQGPQGKTPLETLAAVKDEDRRAIFELLRKHATLAVLEPVVVSEDDGDETHLPVKLLTLPQLMSIWNATTVLPVMDPDKAATFRLRKPAPAKSVPQPREDVRPAAEPVALPPDIEYIEHA